MDEPAQGLPASPPTPSPLSRQRSRRAIIKRTYDGEILAEQVAASIISKRGTGFQTDPQLGPVTDHDRMMLQRVTAMTVEEFNGHVSARLRTIAQRACQRIEQKLDADEFAPGELGFILSVAEDKRTRLDGSHSLANASVNIQVNNFGSDPNANKDALLSGLMGKGTPMKQASPSGPSEPSKPIAREGAKSTVEISTVCTPEEENVKRAKSRSATTSNE